jgi:NFU1 iron-sulfur cluster scaffold homolog, mitochondrial
MSARWALSLMERFVNIYSEASPNPNSMKFVVNLMLTPDESSFDFPEPVSALHAPLALELFGFDFVQRVFIMNNFVTITKDEATDWNEVIPELKIFLKQYLESGKSVFSEKGIQDIAENAGNDNDPEIVKKIKHLLDEYVRPAVESDGGAITFHSYDEGTVKLLMQGSCSGCPSSTLTLKAGIENLLKRMLPEVQQVVAEGV